MTKNTTDNDRLIGELRAQAGAFHPPPPADLRRRIFSAIIDAEATGAPVPARTPWLLLGWSAAVTAILVGLVTVLASGRSRPSPAPVARATHGAPATTTPLPRTSFAIANPMSLANEYLNQPLEAEVRTLLGGLAQTRDTVARVLPAPARRAGPATRPPADASRRG